MKKKEKKAVSDLTNNLHIAGVAVSPSTDLRLREQKHREYHMQTTDVYKIIEMFYRNILSASLQGTASKLIGRSCIIQQDSGPKYTATNGFIGGEKVEGFRLTKSVM